MKPTIDILRQRLETEGKVLLQKAVWEEQLCQSIGKDCPTHDTVRSRAAAIRASWTDKNGVLRVKPANQWDESVEPPIRVVRRQDMRAR